MDEVFRFMSNIAFWFFAIGIPVTLVWWGISLLNPPSRNTPTTDETVERAYIIRRKSDGYPVEVNEAQLQRALRTGDYEVVNEVRNGVTYSGTILDGKFVNNLVVPAGYRIKEGAKTKDERLGS